MDRVRFSIKSIGGKPALVILLSVLLLTITLPQAARSQVAGADKQKVIHRVAKDWIEVGATQYKRGLYNAAEQSLLRAQDWQEYLSAGECKKLSELLKKTHLAALERVRISEYLKKADELTKQGELIRAKANLETIRYSKFLTKEEEKGIAEKLDRIESQINEQNEQKKQSTELYNHSVEFFRTGQLEKAREGFLEVVKKGIPAAPSQTTAEDYLVKIDNALILKVKPSSPTEAKTVEKTPEAAITTIKNELLDVAAKPAEKTERQIPTIKSEPKRTATAGAAERKSPEQITTEARTTRVL